MVRATSFLQCSLCVWVGGVEILNSVCVKSRNPFHQDYGHVLGELAERALWKQSCTLLLEMRFRSMCLGELWGTLTFAHSMVSWSSHSGYSNGKEPFSRNLCFCGRGLLQGSPTRGKVVEIFAWDHVERTGSKP